MPDHAEGEVVRDEVRARNHGKHPSGHEQDAVRHGPSPVPAPVVCERTPHDGHGGLAVQIGRMHQHGRVDPPKRPVQFLFLHPCGHPGGGPVADAGHAADRDRPPAFPLGTFPVGRGQQHFREALPRARDQARLRFVRVTGQPLIGLLAVQLVARRADRHQIDVHR